MQPREAGVLILLFPRDNGWHFFLTRRTDTVETHKGQISLPGGSQEPGETLAQTAVRETAEELGIARACIEILGAALTPLFVPVSGFRITPFVAFAATCPTVVAEPSEVTEVIHAPLDVIVDEAQIAEEQWLIRELPVTVPFYPVQGHKVWGATAMILSEFGAMLSQAIEK